MGLGFSVHDTHIVNTVVPVLVDVTDQEVSLLFRSLWRRSAVPVSQTYGTCLLIVRPLHGATCEDEGFVAHVRGGEGFSRQVCDPLPELVMNFLDEAAPIAIEGVTNGEFGVAAFTVIGEVWGLYEKSQEEGITPFLRPQLYPVHRGRLHLHPGPSIFRPLQTTCALEWGPCDGLHQGLFSTLCAPLPNRSPYLSEAGQVVCRQ